MQPTTSEILSIIETYEGLLRQEWRADLLAKWTEWKAVLAKGGR